MSIVDQHKEALHSLCRAYRVKRLYTFGSFETNRFTPDSDIDLLVSFGDVDPSAHFDNYLGMKESLEKLLDRNIDLLEDQAVKNPVLRRTIDRDKKLIYG